MPKLTFEENVHPPLVSHARMLADNLKLKGLSLGMRVDDLQAPATSPKPMSQTAPT